MTTPFLQQLSDTSFIHTCRQGYLLARDIATQGKNYRFNSEINNFPFYKYDSGDPFIVTFEFVTSGLPGSVDIVAHFGEYFRHSRPKHKEIEVPSNQAVLWPIASFLFDNFKDKYYVVGTAAAVIHGFPSQLKDVDIYAIRPSVLHDMHISISEMSKIDPLLEVGEMVSVDSVVFSGLTFEFKYRGVTCNVSVPDRLSAVEFPLRNIFREVHRIAVGGQGVIGKVRTIELPVVRADDLKFILRTKDRPKDRQRLKDIAPYF